jgi:autotransporter-associated beta strand protein
VLSNSGVITVSSANTLVIRSRISGPGGYLKAGTGTLELAAILANTYTGTTTVSDGYLELNHVILLPSPVGLISIPGPLIIGGTNQSLFPIVRLQADNQVADSAAVTVNDNGQLWLNGYDDTIGSLTLDGGIVDTIGGTLTLNGDVNATAPVLSGMAGQINGKLNLGTLSRTFTMEDTNAVLQVNATISGSGSGHAFAGITKAGPGTLSLSGTNTYAGYTIVNAGTLTAKSPGALGSTNLSVQVAANAILSLSGSGVGLNVSNKSLLLNGGATLTATPDCGWHGPINLTGQALINVPANLTLTIDGIVSGAGGFTKTGNGELLFIGLATNTFTGLTWVREGKITLDRHEAPSPYTGRVVISGPLLIGTNIAMPPGLVAPPTVLALARDQIADSSAVTVQASGQLVFDWSVDTIGSLAVNSGYVEADPFSVSVAGDITCTNLFSEPGLIVGALSFTDGPHTIYVNPNDVGLDVLADIYGGSTNVTKKGTGTLTLQGTSSTFSAPLVISEGQVLVTDGSALGDPASPTIVSNGASLWFMNDFQTEEKLVLNGREAPGGDTAAALYCVATNQCSGIVELGSDTAIHVGPNSKLSLVNRIRGPGGYHKVGPGMLVVGTIGGSTTGNNDYAGTTWADQGKLILQRSVGNNFWYAVPGPLEIATGPALGVVEVRASRRGQFGSDHKPITLGANGKLFFDANTNWIGALVGSGIVTIATNAQAIISFQEGSFTYAGILTGGAPDELNLGKIGNGIQELKGVNVLAGPTLLYGGELRISSTQLAASFFVQGGTLSGTGHVGTILLEGGFVAPGGPVGRLKANNLERTSEYSGILDVELNGPLAGISYDQLEVTTAAPVISNMVLFVKSAPGFVATNGQQFTVLKNSTGQPVKGRFKRPGFGGEIEEGQYLNSLDNTAVYTLSYVGGSGHDVVLTKILPEPVHFHSLTKLVDGAVKVMVTAEPGFYFLIEANDDLNNPMGWIPLDYTMSTPSGLAYIIDTDAPNYPQRFYRFVPQ